MLRVTATLALAVVIFAAAAAPAASQDAQTFVDVTLNGVEKGQALVVMSDGDVLMLPKDLDGYGIAYANAARRTVSGDTFVSLQSLAPQVRFKLDATTFDLSLSVAAAQFGTHDIALSAANRGTNGDPRESAFLNYAGTFDSGGDAGGSAQIGFHRKDAVFSTGGSIETGGIATRGLTFVAFDDVPHTHRVQLGDSLVDGDSLVGGGTLLGVTTSRQFSLDPYAYIFPQPAIAGSIASAGTAQIYINGGLTQTVALQPGVFDLSNLPVQTGPNQVSVVVRDAQGQVQTYGQSYFAVNSLLRKGFTDFQYGAGFLQNSNGQSYTANPAATGAYRIGATNEVTYGAHLAIGNALQSGDLAADLKVGAGSLHLALAQSAGRSAGAAFDVETALNGAGNGLAAGVIARTSRYETLGEAAPPEAPARLDLHLALTQNVARGTTVSLLVFRRTFEDALEQPATAGLALDLVGNLGHNASATLSLQQSRSAGSAPQNSVYLSFVQTLGHRRSVTTTASAGHGQAGIGTAFRLDPPSSNQGFGYTVALGTGAEGSQAHLVDHESYADVDGGLAQTGSGALAYGNLSGGIVSAGGYVLASRPVGDGFAVVSTGEPNVQVLLNNSPVGLTNRAGLLVVPSLTAYAHNDVGVDRRALPLGTEIEVDQISASTSYLGGTLAALPVRHITYVSGRVRLVSGGTSAIPAYGVMMVGPAGRSLRSALDAEGNFYFENLAPGRYPATVVYPGGRCAFELRVTKPKEMGTDLGEVQCTR